MKFYICEHCKNIIVKLNDSGVPVVCCGEKMSELVANTTEAAFEKHIPAAVIDGNKVSVAVGSTLHPMLEEHYIKFVVLETDKGYQVKNLVPGTEPKAEFVLADGEKAVAVYEYCNLHGLWKAEL